MGISLSARQVCPPPAESSAGPPLPAEACMLGRPSLLGFAALQLAICAVASAQPAQFSWQQPHATVKATGDLEWAPRPFEFKAGEVVRYIDFDAGDDANAGTKEKP